MNYKNVNIEEFKIPESYEKNNKITIEENKNNSLNNNSIDLDLVLQNKIFPNKNKIENFDFLKSVKNDTINSYDYLYDNNSLSRDITKQNLSNSSFKSFIGTFSNNVNKFRDIFLYTDNKQENKTNVNNIIQPLIKLDLENLSENKNSKKTEEIKNFTDFNYNEKKIPREKSILSYKIKQENSDYSLDLTKRINFYDDNSDDNKEKEKKKTNKIKIYSKNSFDSNEDKFFSKNKKEKIIFTKTNNINKIRILQILERKIFDKPKKIKINNFSDKFQAEKHSVINNINKNNQGIVISKEIDTKLNYNSIFHHFKCIHYKSNVSLITADCLCLKKLTQKINFPNKINLNNKTELICEECLKKFITHKEKAHYRKKCFDCFAKFKKQQTKNFLEF